MNEKKNEKSKEISNNKIVSPIKESVKKWIKVIVPSRTSQTFVRWE